MIIIELLEESDRTLMNALTPSASYPQVQRSEDVRDNSAQREHVAVRISQELSHSQDDQPPEDGTSHASDDNLVVLPPIDEFGAEENTQHRRRFSRFSLSPKAKQTLVKFLLPVSLLSSSSKPMTPGKVRRMSIGSLGSSGASNSPVCSSEKRKRRSAPVVRSQRQPQSIASPDVQPEKISVDTAALHSLDKQPPRIPSPTSRSKLQSYDLLLSVPSSSAPATAAVMPTQHAVPEASVSREDSDVITPLPMKGEASAIEDHSVDQPGLEKVHSPRTFHRGCYWHYNWTYRH
jgi:hypothetical protein